MTRSAVIFDLDGTLTKPYLDFDRIRAEIGVEGPILEALEGMDPVARHQAESILDRHECEAADSAMLYEGALEVLEACRLRGFGVAILTRNTRARVDEVFEKFGIKVDALRTRDDGAIKPSGVPVLSICAELGADPVKSWMVGDYRLDILSGREAGTRTVLMLGDRPTPDFADLADHVIRRLLDLLPLLD